MATDALTLLRPWHQRLFDSAAAGLAKPRRDAAGRDGLHGLGHHLLSDIGIDAGRIEVLAAEERWRAQVVRLHALGGF